MVSKLSEREYARYRGCARSTVQAARRTERLRRSVTRDANGRVWIDPELADAEWEANTRAEHVPLSGPTAPKPRSEPVELECAPAIRIEGLDSVALVIPLSAFLRGVVRALQESGREPTGAALRSVLEGVGVDYWFVSVLGALQSAVDMEIPSEALPTMWEASGREAVEIVHPPKGEK